MQTSYRNTTIDFLRFIGISCIILAHVDIPRIIFQARNFDVPLMVILSGISFVKFSSKKYSSYPKYIYSRFLRLVVPTWIFLFLYCFIDYLFYGDIPDIKNFYKQLFLIENTGAGTWIIRIFVSISIVAPLLFKINQIIQNNKKFFITLISALIVYETSLFYSKLFIPAQIFNILERGVFFTYSYGLIFLYGIRLPTLNLRALLSHIKIFGGIFFLFFVYLFFKNGETIPTQDFKYPPQTYYLSYALFVSTILFFVVTKLPEFKICDTKLFQFIGQSTLWLYIWHLLIIKIYESFEIKIHFLLDYFFIYTTAIFFVYLQKRILYWFISKNFLPEQNNKVLAKIFTG